MSRSRFRMFVAVLLLAALAVPAALWAQQSLRQRMSDADFKAAGLDKLTPGELAHLEAWLQGTLANESRRAAEDARKKVESENRGFFHFNSEEPIVARLTGEFGGFAMGRTYTLDNGQVWQQIDNAELAGVRLSSPAVRITPSIVGDAWYLAVDGYNARAKVKRIR